MRKLTLVASLGLSLLGGASAAELRDIRLEDGGLIRAEIVSFDGQRYTIRSESLGTLRIDGDRIEAITTPRTATGGEEPPADAAGTFDVQASEIAALQRLMIGDEGTTDLLRSLQNDPNVRAIIADDELMQALSSGDLSAFVDDPRIRALMNDPTVRRITGRTLGD